MKKKNFSETRKTANRYDRRVAASQHQGTEQGFFFDDNRNSTAVQRKLIEGINKAGKVDPTESGEEEALLQRKFEMTQRQGVVEEKSVQAKHAEKSAIAQRQVQATAAENKTGLPDNLKSGIESMSGMDMSDVRVHRNSSKPAQLNAHAYAQGSDIHLGAGQEQHLPHEAWHVVQQKQGRVKPTLQMAGKQVNDDTGLEREADIMGQRVLSSRLNVNSIDSVQPSGPSKSDNLTSSTNTGQVTQGVFIFPDSDKEVSVVPNLQKITQNWAIHAQMRSLATESAKHYVYDWDDAINMAEKVLVRRGRMSAPDESNRHVVDMSKVKVNTGTKDVELTSIVGANKVQKQNAEAAGKRGYVGTAIVYTGENNAAGLAENYINNSQDWSISDRKARLAVNFGINSRAEFEPGLNSKAKSDVNAISSGSFGKTKDKVTTFVQGWVWGYKYNSGNLPKSTTSDISTYLADGKIKGKKAVWKTEEDGRVLGKMQVLKKLKEIRGSAGVPYGALRSATGKKTAEAETHLKTTNHTGTVYVHSIDADAPDFSTLKEGDELGEWKKVLDAYDEILESGDRDVVIGGYNLLADSDKYSGKDYQHTVRSNVVDLAIRQAVHSVEPLMTYPTEPNFIIKATEYRNADTQSGRSNVWGSGAYEGRNFIDNYIKSKGASSADIHYDPLASVPTGVDKGGARLKIESGKRYNKDSILGRPQYDTTSKKSQHVSVEDQYVVQAQSWSGASRIATAFRSAYAAKSGGRFTGSKQESIDAFSPIELMVQALVSDERSVTDCSWDVSAFDTKYGTTVSSNNIDVGKILKAVKTRLMVLEKHPDFSKIVE